MRKAKAYEGGSSQASNHSMFPAATPRRRGGGGGGGGGLFCFGFLVCFGVGRGGWGLVGGFFIWGVSADTGSRQPDSRKKSV